MWMIISSKKMEQKMLKSYQEGYEAGRISAPWFKRRINYHAVVGNIYQELNELDKNTWDHERVDRIKKILMMGLEVTPRR